MFNSFEQTFLLDELQWVKFKFWESPCPFLFSGIENYKLPVNFSRCNELHGTVAICTSKAVFKALALWADAFYKSICPYVCLCVSLFTFEVPFKRLFASTSQSQMSKVFRDSESLGKSNGKKWS